MDDEKSCCPPAGDGKSCCGGAGFDVKEEVRKKYSSIVTGKTGCCGSSTAAPQSEKCVGSGSYSEEDLAGVPGLAVGTSLGCGNPLAFSGVKVGDTVLDLGSGAGIDCFIAAKKVGPEGHVIGLDMTGEMIAAARKNAEEGGFANVEFRLGEMEHMPVEDGSVDWVISNCVINLSPDKPQVFREIHRVLKPGGKIRVSDIVTRDLPESIARSVAAWTGCVAGALDEKEYIETIRAAGFIDVRIDEKFAYDKTGLQALGECGDTCCDVSAEDMKMLDGKIASVIVVAHKS